MTYVDDKGYLRDTYGKLIHRQIAYQKIYEKNQHKYEDYFKKLDVHHVDGDKQNNKVVNLFICSHEDHKRIHKEQKRKLQKFKTKTEINRFLKTKEKKPPYIEPKHTAVMEQREISYTPVIEEPMRKKRHSKWGYWGIFVLLVLIISPTTDAFLSLLLITAILVGIWFIWKQLR